MNTKDKILFILPHSIAGRLIVSSIKDGFEALGYICSFYDEIYGGEFAEEFSKNDYKYLISYDFTAINSIASISIVPRKAKGKRISNFEIASIVELEPREVESVDDEEENEAETSEDVEGIEPERSDDEVRDEINGQQRIF